MTSKIDLEELEHKAREATQGTWWISDEDGALCSGPEGPNSSEVGAMDLGVSDTAHVLANSPPVTIALVTRIRALEKEVLRGAALLEARSDMGARRSWAEDLRSAVNKGTVLPPNNCPSISKELPVPPRLDCPHCAAGEPSVWDDVLFHYAHPDGAKLKSCHAPWRERCLCCSSWPCHAPRNQESL